MLRYFALELCDASLDRLFLKGVEQEKYRGPRLQDMPLPQNVFSQLAEGMAYIHEKGITHRDVKPYNALIHVRKRLEQKHQVIFKWADFGGSKKVNITGECSMSGFKFTTNWCAPEVLKIYEQSSQSNRITERYGTDGTIQSDVFSEGLVFVYYLLKGEHPYGNHFYNKHKLKEGDSINLESKVSFCYLKQIFTQQHNCC
jgi:serine/threonine-protein kinase/endoribonuclease IRE1